LLEINPQDYEAWNNLGLAQARLGRTHEAEQSYDRAIHLRPGSPFARRNLAQLHFAVGRGSAAAAEFRELLQDQPDDLEAATWLAWILATGENGGAPDVVQARALAETCATATQSRNPQVLAVLAAACAAAGEYDLAVRHQTDAVSLMEPNAAAEYIRRLDLYKSHRPYCRPPGDERVGAAWNTGP